MNRGIKYFLTVISITICFISTLSFQVHSSARQTPGKAESPENRSIALAVKLLGKDSPPPTTRTMPVTAGASLSSDEVETDICRICLESPIKKHGKYAMTPCCSEKNQQKMCRPCLDEWVQTNNTCPLCRAYDLVQDSKIIMSMGLK